MTAAQAARRLSVVPGRLAGLVSEIASDVGALAQALARDDETSAAVRRRILAAFVARVARSAGVDLTPAEVGAVVSRLQAARR